MNRTELILLISVAFFMTFLAGWVLRWAYGRLNRIQAASVSEIEDLATRLHDAEETRDQAMTYLQQREHELLGQITQMEAEHGASMEALGNARREIEALRDHINTAS